MCCKIQVSTLYIIIYNANLDINHDLYASAIRKNQDHPIFMALEVSVCEPQNYV